MRIPTAETMPVEVEEFKVGVYETLDSVINHKGVTCLNEDRRCVATVVRVAGAGVCEFAARRTGNGGVCGAGFRAQTCGRATSGSF